MNNPTKTEKSCKILKPQNLKKLLQVEKAPLSPFMYKESERTKHLFPTRKTQVTISKLSENPHENSITERKIEGPK